MEDHKKIGNVTILWGKYKGPLIASNTLVVEHGGDTIIIDPGGESGELKRLSEKNCLIVNSHYHGDHRRMNYLFTKSEFFAPGPDAPMIESNERFLEATGIPERDQTELWLQIFKGVYRITEHRVAGTFDDNEYVIDRKYGIKAIALPGHTPGHSGFYFESIDLAVITDIDLTAFGPWYGNEASDINAFLESIEKVKRLRAKHIMTSHSRKIYARDELLPLLDRFAEHIGNRDTALLGLLDGKGALSLDELATCGIIYSQKSLLNNPAFLFFEKKMIEKHLKRLGRKIKV